MAHPMRRKLTPRRSVPEMLEEQAARLRAMAAAWCESATPPDILVGKYLCSTFVLSYTDLIDDAAQLEADAAKIRTAYR